MKEQPQCEVDKNGTKIWRLNGRYHREDGPAVETKDGYRAWYIHGKIRRPEQIVDYHLMRGTFCYYNEGTETLHFAESK